MLALYDEFDTYWQNGGYKKILDIIFAESHIFIVSNLWLHAALFLIILCARCIILIMLCAILARINIYPR
jgi:hypothetical protein